MAYGNRADLWIIKKEYDKSIADYNEALRLNPADAYNWNARAWFAATCPDAKYRNGKNAVADATKACELTAWKNGGWIDTLAAAYAEAGDFESAVKWQTTSIELADEKSKADLRSRFELYKAGKPYRQEVKK